MTPQDYDYLRRLLKERSGLVLSAEKHYLVESRLLPLARRHGDGDLTGLVSRLRLTRDETLIREVVEAMTTNESFFFRDKLPFERIRDTVLPALMAARASSRRIRIWCAAAAAGQEPYSVAMLLKEMGKELAGWRFDLIATDLSTGILEKAIKGLYSQFEVQRGLPVSLLIKYFEKTGEQWQVAPELRGMVKFMPLNLMSDFSRFGRFDLVLCRNVLIYFDQPTKTQVLDRIADCTEPDGYLIMGGAETVFGITESFRPIPDKHGVYEVRTSRPAVERASNVLKFPPLAAAARV